VRGENCFFLSPTAEKRSCSKLYYLFALEIQPREELKVKNFIMQNTPSFFGFNLISEITGKLHHIICSTFGLSFAFPSSSPESG
jgi:hypothetical protein